MQSNDDLYNDKKLLQEILSAKGKVTYIDNTSSTIRITVTSNDTAYNLEGGTPINSPPLQMVGIENIGAYYICVKFRNPDGIDSTVTLGATSPLIYIC